MSNPPLNKHHKVGKISKEIASIANFNFTGDVFATPGAIKHIQKRHKFGKNSLTPKVMNNLLSVIKQVISSPDYIGKHPNKIGNSIELVKKIHNNILVAVEVDLDNDYIYVSSMYAISDGKIRNRVNSGRFIKFLDVSLEEVATAKS